MEIPEFYFKNDTAWRQWLIDNHKASRGVQLIFFKKAHEEDSMSWEEAVRVALCFGWIDSTVKGLGDGKRRQYFCPRKPKSVWSKLNKTHIKELKAAGLMHMSGLERIRAAKRDGSWTALDDVEKGIIPHDLQRAFECHPTAKTNFENFTRGQRKSYLYWLNQAKRDTTRQDRIVGIIRFCEANMKTRA